MPRGMLFLSFGLLLMLVAAWASHRFAPSEASVEAVVLRGNPEPQTIDQRLWRRSPDPVFRIEDQRLLQGIASAIHDDNYFVLDYRDQAVKRFTSRGELVSVARMDADRFSPDARPSHFGIAPSGEIFVAYRDLGAVRIFTSNGDLLRSLRLQTPPHRIAVLSDSEFVVMTGKPDDFLFQRYSVDGRLLSSFGRLVEGVQDPLPLDGWIAPDGHGGIVYVSFHSGVLARFDAISGSRLFLVYGIQGGGFSPVVVDASGRRHVKPGSPIFSFTMNVDGGRIYVLTTERKHSHLRMVLDAYDLHTGKYRWSTRLQEPLHYSSVRGPLLLGGTANRLGLWRLPIPPESSTHSKG